MSRCDQRDTIFPLHAFGHFQIVNANATGLVRLWLPLGREVITKEAYHLIQCIFVHTLLFHDFHHHADVEGNGRNGQRTLCHNRLGNYGMTASTNNLA